MQFMEEFASAIVDLDTKGGGREGGKEVITTLKLKDLEEGI